ncbi:MAG: PAS domain-containing protein [Pseudomonadota bacterium]
MEVFNASPSALLVVDDDVRTLHFNRAAEDLLGGPDCQRLLRQRGGEILHCLHANEDPGGCGRSAACRECVVRNAVGRAMGGERTQRQKAAMDLFSEQGVNRVSFLVTASPFSFDGQQLVLLALEDISELMALRGLLPICASCKKIRDEKNYWLELESYFKKYLGMEFSHGICPECARKLYPENY